MTRTRTLAFVIVALLLIVASCELPAPTPDPYPVPATQDPYLTLGESEGSARTMVSEAGRQAWLLWARFVIRLRANADLIAALALVWIAVELRRRNAD